MVSDAEVEQFRSLGFVILRGVLDPAQTAQLRDEVDGALREVYGATYGMNTRDDMPADDVDEVAAEGNFLPLMSTRSPLSLSLVADDGRFWSAAERLLDARTSPWSRRRWRRALSPVPRGTTIPGPAVGGCA